MWRPLHYYLCAPVLPLHNFAFDNRQVNCFLHWSVSVWVPIQVCDAPPFVLWLGHDVQTADSVLWHTSFSSFLIDARRTLSFCSSEAIRSRPYPIGPILPRFRDIAGFRRRATPPLFHKNFRGVPFGLHCRCCGSEKWRPLSWLFV